MGSRETERQGRERRGKESSITEDPAQTPAHPSTRGRGRNPWSRLFEWASSWWPGEGMEGCDGWHGCCINSDQLELGVNGSRGGGLGTRTRQGKSRRREVRGELKRTHPHHAEHEQHRTLRGDPMICIPCRAVSDRVISKFSSSPREDRQKTLKRLESHRKLFKRLEQDICHISSQASTILTA